MQMVRTDPFKIPEDALMESFGPLAVQGVSFADYAKAAEELILELAERELIATGGAGTRCREKTASLGCTQSICAVFESRRDRSEFG